MGTVVMQPMTAKQKEVYDYIVKCIGEGCPPTFQEIADEFDIAINSVVARIGWIEKKGYVSMRPGKSRGIFIVK